MALKGKHAANLGTTAGTYLPRIKMAGYSFSLLSIGFCHLQLVELANILIKLRKANLLKKAEVSQFEISV